MGILILCVLVALLFGGWVAVEVWREYRELGGLGFLAFVLVLAVGFGLFVGATFGVFLPQHPVPYQNIGLAAFQDSNGVQGSFFLGSGYVESTPVYFFMKQRDDGGVVEAHIGVEGVVIYETDNNFAYMQIYRSEFDASWEWWFGFPMQDYAASIYLPKGSVVRNFKVDLQ